MTPKSAKSKFPTLLQPQNSYLFSVYVYLNTTAMSCLKIIYTSRAYIHQHQNLKRKLYICTANVYLNQKCLRSNIIPKFAKIKIPNKSPALKFTSSLYIRILKYDGDGKGKGKVHPRTGHEGPEGE
jgi:hypothetical protein